jgi:hypothetical protein
MSDNPPENPIVENLEPPEVKLTAPALFEIENTWLVVAKNRRVNRDWEALMQRHPENQNNEFSGRGWNVWGEG